MVFSSHVIAQVSSAQRETNSLSEGTTLSVEGGRQPASVSCPLTSQLFQFHLAKADGKSFHPSSWSPPTGSTSHPSFFRCCVVCTHSLIALSGGQPLSFKRCLGTICFQKVCMFVIFRTSVLDPFGCSPKESHADLALNLSRSHALFPTPKCRKSCCNSCQFVHLRLFSVLGPWGVFYKHTVSLRCLGT